jgi:hypothetical protein
MSSFSSSLLLSSLLPSQTPCLSTPSHYIITTTAAAIGEWYGPSTASLVLRDLTRLHRRKYGGPVEAHVTTGDTIYITEVGRQVGR